MARRPQATTEEADRAALFAKLKGWVRQSLDDHADWYAEARECFGFVSGRSVKGEGQWPGTSWQDMIDSGRQPIEFNRVGPIVDSICGLEINNRQEIKFLPRTQGDVEVDERLSSLAEWARDEAHSEDEESEAFRNAAICGRGATETRLDFTEEPTGKFVDDSLDPLECGVDPAARKQCFADRRYSWRWRDMASDEAQAAFPGVDAKAIDATWARTIDTRDGGEGNKTDYPDETRPALKDDRTPRTVRVVMIEWWEPVDVMLVAKPEAAEPEEMSAEAWAGVEKDATGAGWTAQSVKRRRYRKAFLGRNGILDQSDIACFYINWVTGRYDRNKGYHYGVVRPMRDPQMLSNKTLAQVLHILNTNAKGGLMIEQGAFRNPRDAEKDWSNPAKTVILNDGGLAKIKERTAPQIPQALVALQEFSLSSIRDVTGANVEMLGQADRDQPASLEYQRRQSAMVILASLFNSLRHYRKLKGRSLIELLRLLPPGVLVRVLIDPQVAMAEWQQAMAQWAAAAQQAQAQGQQPPPQPEPPTAEFMSQTKRGEAFDPNKFGLGPDARFDVIVDETPSSPNQKEATWAALQPFMAEIATIPAAVQVALKYSPLPETAAEELGKAIGEAAQGPQVPPELQKAMQDGQAQIQSLTEENQQLKAKLTAQQGKTMVDAARVDVERQNADTRQFQAQSADQHAQTGHFMDAIRILAENQQAMMARIDSMTTAG